MAGCSADLNHFRMKWQRQYGMPVAVWKREYQIGEPCIFTWRFFGQLSRVLWRRFVGGRGRRGARLWGAFQGGCGCIAEATCGLFLKSWSTRPRQRGTKTRCPMGSRTRVGFGERGICRQIGTRSSWVPEEFVECRRIMRAWARSKRLKQRPNGGRVQGMWVRSRYSPAYQLGSQFLRATRLSVT